MFSMKKKEKKVLETEKREKDRRMLKRGDNLPLVLPITDL